MNISKIYKIITALLFLAPMISSCAVADIKTDLSDNTSGQTSVEVETNSLEYYYVRTIFDDDFTQRGSFDNLNEAKVCADNYARYGYRVYNESGEFVYAPFGDFAADILLNAKWVCDYVRVNNFTYGDAPINPAINHDAKKISCDRLVDWVLYRLDFTDQPKVQGMCVEGPGLTNWCIDHDFVKIENIDDILPGDIIFVRANKNGDPGHVFIHAGESDEDGMYYRYDCGRDQRIQSNQPSCEVINDFMYAYRIVK